MRVIVEQLVEWKLVEETLSTTNPTWPDPGSNPGRRGGKLATNRLSYGAAYIVISIVLHNHMDDMDHHQMNIIIR
jgi:hypothetical protein